MGDILSWVRVHVLRLFNVVESQLEGEGGLIRKFFFEGKVQMNLPWDIQETSDNFRHNSAKWIMEIVMDVILIFSKKFDFLNFWISRPPIPTKLSLRTASLRVHSVHFYFYFITIDFKSDVRKVILQKRETLQNSIKFVQFYIFNRCHKSHELYRGWRLKLYNFKLIQVKIFVDRNNQIFQIMRAKTSTWTLMWHLWKSTSSATHSNFSKLKLYFD